jgi:signal transduction histidine kinase
MVSAESLILPAIVTTIVSMFMVREVWRRRGMERYCATLQSGRESTIRLLRLAASDQRSVALALFGYAQASQPPDAELTGLARRLLDMSEDLAQQTDSPGALRHLREEEVQVLSVVEFAMAQVASHLGPGRRAWRLSPELADLRIKADRRAVNQVLVNVLSGAAAATRNGDWIEVAADRDEEGVCLVVQDEGIGLPESANDPRSESRGIGLRLTLARSLMQAHGGTLTVESAERVGTRVRLCFPAERAL